MKKKVYRITLCKFILHLSRVREVSICNLNSNETSISEQIEQHVSRNNIKVTNRNGNTKRVETVQNLQLFFIFVVFELSFCFFFFFLRRGKEKGYKYYTMVHTIQYGLSSLKGRTRVDAAPYS